MMAWFRDDNLPPQIAANDADRPWWGLPALAATVAALFYGLHGLYRRNILIGFEPGDLNIPADPDTLAVFLAVVWLAIVAGWFVPLAYKRSYILLASLATIPILFPLKAFLAIPVLTVVLFYLARAAWPKWLKWLLLIAFWTLLWLAWRRYLEPVIVHRHLHFFGLLTFIALFLKSIYYLFEKTTLLAGQPEDHPLRNLFIYLMSFPIFIVPQPNHLKPISYHYLHSQFMARPRTKVLRDGVVLFGQGLLYMMLYSTLFTRWLDWSVVMPESELANWQVLFFSHYNFLKIFLHLAGNAYLAVGLWRLFGFDIKADFYYPFFAKNLLEHWRRWNIYNRDFVVALIFNPVLLKLGRKINKYWAYMIACFLCFFVGLGVLVHLIPLSYAFGYSHFIYAVLVRSGLLGVLTGLNIWLVLFMSQKGRNRRLQEKFGRWKIVNVAVRLVKIYLTFFLMSCIYMIQQGLTHGLKLTEVLHILSKIFY